MKRINVDSENKNSRLPFWMPWGFAGTALRYTLFLLLLAMYIGFLWWLMNQNYRSPHLDDDPVNIDDKGQLIIKDDDIKQFVIPDENTVDPRNQQLIDVINPDTRRFDDRNVTNPVRELPRPDDNLIKPVPHDDIITNPDDEFKQIISTRLNVILNGEPDEQVYNRFAQEFKQLYPSDAYFINYYNKMTQMIQLTVPADQRENVKNNLPGQITDVDFKIFSEEIFGQSKGPSDYNDPIFKDPVQSWHFEPIQAYDAWAITQGSPDVVVAVIDSYIDVTHPELKDHFKDPYSVERQSTDVLPPPGPYSLKNDADAPIYHGTHVAGLAVGELNNGQGAAGIAPKSTLIPISLGKQITSMSMIDAVLYAIHKGADVINLSIGNIYADDTQMMPIEDQIQYIHEVDNDQEDIWNYVFKLADERNCMIVWAAGNCNVVAGMDETKRNSSTLRVSAVDPQLRKADFSNYGDFEDQGMTYSDISAPGASPEGGVVSSVPGNKYGYCPGTSMAAPIVTGAVALMKSLNPNLTNAQIIKILKDTGKPIKDNDGKSIGKLIQIADALRAVKGDMANFDEIKDDPSKIIGTWQTTERRMVETNGVPTGEECHIFLDFKSPQGGTIYYEETTGHTYSAPFKATFSGDKIYIDQDLTAKSSTTDVEFMPSHMVSVRADDGRLKCVNKRNNSEFYLVRVDRRPGQTGNNKSDKHSK